MVFSPIGCALRMLVYCEKITRAALHPNPPLKREGADQGQTEPQLMAPEGALLATGGRGGGAVRTSWNLATE